MMWLRRRCPPCHGPRGLRAAGLVWLDPV